jgi:hypothetical protein
MIQSEIVESFRSQKSQSKLFPAVWAMRRKRRVDTRDLQVKARMNLDGSKQRKDRLRSDICSSSDVGINPATAGNGPRTNGRQSNSTTFWRSRKLQLTENAS